MSEGSGDGFTGEVHPAADLFPMYPEADLADLAADIKRYGLSHPILLDDQGRLIDGRNRLAACRIAGVEPRYETIDGADPVRKTLSENAMRRSVTKGQLAIIVAATFSKFEKGRPISASEYGLSASQLSEAEIILEYAPREAEQVIRCLMTAHEALTLARERREAATTDTDRLARIRRADPHLAALVQEGTLSVRAAWTELQERREKEKEEKRQQKEYQQTLTRELARILLHLDPTDRDPLAAAANWLQADARLLPDLPDLGPERALRAAETLRLYAAMRSEQDAQAAARPEPAGATDRLFGPGDRGE